MADTKASALTELTTPALEDLLYIVDDPSGTPTSKRVTLANVFGVALDVGARVYHDANQSTADNTDVVLAFNSERYDTDAFHDTVTNNSRLTVPSGQGGKYLISGHVTWDTNDTGSRYLKVLLNGATTIASQQAPADNFNRMSITTIYELSATDYIQLQSYQNSGDALNVLASSNYQAEFALQRIG